MIRFAWNGGRNGWASFIVGVDWRINGIDKTWRERIREVRRRRFFICFYLGLWTLSYDGRG